MERSLKVLSKELIPSRLELPEGKLLLAFSGGSDSLCLLYLLSSIAKDRTSAVYINHKIRACDELSVEIELNRHNAAKLGIPFHVIELEDNAIDALDQEKDIGIEGAARELRYRALEDFRRENSFDYILTAHHREDQIETLLMRMLQNSPFYTYRGILKEDGHIFRPLLEVSKREIMDILSQSGLKWSEDSTNKDLSYLRNSIRHRIMPALNSNEKDLLVKIASNVAIFRKDECIEWDANPYYSKLDRDAFLALSNHEREKLIYSILSTMGIKGRIRRSFINEVSCRAEKGTGRFERDGIDIFFMKDEIRLYRQIADFVVLFDSNTEKAGPFSILREPYDEKDLTIDFSLLSSPVILRTSREGDRISLKNGEKCLSDLERELHVPYSIVLEDREGIAASFSRFLGGKDRLAKRLLDREGDVVRIGL